MNCFITWTWKGKKYSNCSICRSLSSILHWVPMADVTACEHFCSQLRFPSTLPIDHFKFWDMLDWGCASCSSSCWILRFTLDHWLQSLVRQESVMQMSWWLQDICIMNVLILSGNCYSLDLCFWLLHNPQRLRLADLFFLQNYIWLLKADN